MVRRFRLVALLLAAACTFPEVPLPAGQREVVVHAVLDLSAQTQLVALSMSNGVSMKPGDLDSALVTITTPDGQTLVLHQDPVVDSTSQYNYHAPTASYLIDLQKAGVALVADGTYQLRVETKLGDVITGETTIPSAAPAPLSAPSTFVRSRDTLWLAWNNVPGARTYEAQVWRTQTYGSGTYTYSYNDLRYQAFTDTTLTFAGTAKDWTDDEIFSPGSTARVYVYAVDDNYYQYYRLLGDPFVGAAPTRLKGGVGVFGAVVPLVRRQLTVK